METLSLLLGHSEESVVDVAASVMFNISAVNPVAAGMLEEASISLGLSRDPVSTLSVQESPLEALGSEIVKEGSALSLPACELEDELLDDASTENLGEQTRGCIGQSGQCVLQPVDPNYLEPPRMLDKRPVEPICENVQYINSHSLANTMLPQKPQNNALPKRRGSKH